MPCTILGTRDTAVNKTDKNSCSRGMSLCTEMKFSDTNLSGDAGLPLCKGEQRWCSVLIGQSDSKVSEI